MLTVTPLHPLFGARVAGIDLRRPVAPDAAAELRAAFARYSVLHLPDQPLDDAAQVAFSRVFGAVRRTSFKMVGAHPYVSDLSNVDAEGNFLAPDSARRKFLLVNSRWHTDGSYEAQPPIASMLAARAAPAHGGETAFASMRAGYAALPEAMRTRAAGLGAAHDYAYSMSHYGDAGVGAAELAPPATHPLVKRHAPSGETTLYVSGHIERIHGMAVADGRRLAEDLIAWCTRPERVYTHRWRDGDVVIWDNRCTLHRAIDVPLAERRILKRTTIVERAP